MDHGGEAARPTTVGSADLVVAGAVQGSDANTSSGTFHVQHGEVPVAVLFHLHHELGHGVAYANIGELWRQRGPVDAALRALHLPDGIVSRVLDNYAYSALQPRPGAGNGEVLVDLLPNGAGHGEAFVGQLPGGGVAAYDDYVYYALQPRPGARHGEVLVDLLPDGAGHGEVFVGLLPGAGRGEVFIGPLPDRIARETLPGTGPADRIVGMLRDPNLGQGYDSSGALADDHGAGYDNSGMVAEHLRRLHPFVGIGASSMAVNGLAAVPGSPAIAFHLFVLLLGGLFLVTLHVLRV